MPITVTHSTPADGTFSAAGQAAWDDEEMLMLLMLVAQVI